MSSFCFPHCDTAPVLGALRASVAAGHSSEGQQGWAGGQFLHNSPSPFPVTQHGGIRGGGGGEQQLKLSMVLP